MECIVMSHIPYKQGTFTPTVFGSTNGGTTTYSSQTGHYIRIGNQVTVWASIGVTGCTDTGNLTFGGLPYNLIPNSSYRPVGPLVLGGGIQWNGPAGWTQLSVQGIGTVNGSVYALASGNAANETAFSVANVSFNVFYSITYLTEDPL